MDDFCRRRCAKHRLLLLYIVMANELMDAYHAGRMDAFAKVLSQRQYLRLDQAGTDWLKAQFDKELAAKQADAAL